MRLLKYGIVSSHGSGPKLHRGYGGLAPTFHKVYSTHVKKVSVYSKMNYDGYFWQILFKITLVA